MRLLHNLADILFDNPVFGHEARGWLRLRWLRRSRPTAWTVAILAAVVVWLTLQALAGDSYSFQSWWFWLTRGLLIPVIMLPLLIASAGITREREQRTWESLALTRLAGREIIVGKWLSALVPVCLLLLAVTPLLLLVAVGLGENYAPVGSLVVFYLVTAAGYALLGLFCSFFARHASAARTAALTAAIALCLGTLIADGLVSALYPPEFRQFWPSGSRQVSPWALIGNSYYPDWSDFGYHGLPAISWFSPLFVLSVFSNGMLRRNQFIALEGQTPEDDMDIWSTHPSHVLLVYSLSLAVGAAFGLYYMLTRYRRDVRGGRPLGEPIA